MRTLYHWQVLPIINQRQGTFGQGFTSYLKFRGHQGSHKLEKYLNLEGFLEKSLKIKSALKSTGKSLLEKSLNSTIFCRTEHSDIDLNHYKIVVPLFGAAYAAPNKGTTIFY